MRTALTLTGAIVLCVATLQGQGASADGLWQPIVDTVDRIQLFGIDLGVNRPATIKPFRLDIKRLATVLGRARAALDADSPLLSIPMPDGRYVDFWIEETAVMPKELAASLGNFRTFRGQSKSDPMVTARIEHGPDGLRALVFSPQGRVFVEPVRRPEPAYVIYSAGPLEDQAPLQGDARPPRCQVTADDVGRVGALRADRKAARRPEVEPAGSILRTYRLAVGATGEYTAKHGGTAAKATRAIGSTVNRINEVYERDLGVRFVLVDDQVKLVHLDAATDPYTNNDADLLLSENQAELDRALGSAGYDIGHVFSTGAGGKAFAGACDITLKARGATGKSNPAGDPFDIDYVAHEVGHQLGANHTFNSTTDDCGPHRFAATAYEPGSGSTVLSYAGVCGVANIQPNSHDYLHAGSLAEIRTFLTSNGGDACAAKSPSKNTPPRVDVPQRRVVIPKDTPFALTGSAADAEQNDIRFSWEQMDLGPSSPPDSDDDGLARPLFRSLAPSAGAMRLFPALDVLQAGTARIGDTLPRTSREMRFRLTARDRARPAGGFGFAEVTVKVADAGPFMVTSPSAGAIVPAGSTFTVQWTVNGTDRGEVGCTGVRLRLSTDDGASFPIELIGATANDASETVTIPASASGVRARVRVECATQPFFAFSRQFTIGPPSQTRRR